MKAETTKKIIEVLKKQVAQARWNAHRAQGTMMGNMMAATLKYWEQELKNQNAVEKCAGERGQG